MEKDDPKPETKPAGNRPPPRPPYGTAVGLGPDGDDSDKKGRVTITKAADGEGKFIRESGGLGQYGHVIVKIAPNARGKGILISSDVTSDTIPEKYIKPITDMIREGLDEGIYDGRPMVDILVRIVGGSWDKRDSNEMAFKMAGIFALKDAVKRAEPITVE
jgi:elongation factor G